MKDNANCPECFDRLSPHARACACGWRKSQEVKDSEPHRCSYRLGERRCGMLGVIALSTRGSNFLCRAHYKSRDNAALSAAILDDFEKNSWEWKVNVKDWRVLMLEERLSKQPRITQTKTTSMDEQLKKLKQLIINGD